MALDEDQAEVACDDGATDDDAVLAGHLQELRRGTVVVASLAALGTERHGYQLIDELSASGIAVGGDTLYPLLRRLERQGLLTSEWNTDEARPRKFYVTTPAGGAVLAALVAEWRRLDSAIDVITQPKEAL
jgi:PadR family transcriptional regulator PadR